MTRRALTLLILAVLIVGGIATVIASTVSGDNDAAATHDMSSGQTMQGHDMSSPATHTMSDGQTMSGTEMEK